MAHPVIVLVDDLMFESRIRATAEAVGCALEVVRTHESLAARLAASPGATVIVDLNAEGTDVIEAIRVTRRMPAPPRTYAYLSHVQVELGQAAQEAGADEVMARSQFVKRLPELLGGG